MNQDSNVHKSRLHLKIFKPQNLSRKIFDPAFFENVKNYLFVRNRQIKNIFKIKYQ